MREIPVGKPLAINLRAMQLIWLAMLASLIVYAVIANLVVPKLAEMPPMKPKEYAILRYVLMAAGIVVLAAAGLVRKRLVNPLRPASPGVQGMTFDDPSRVGRVMTGMLISLALSESVGIFGLVLFFVGREYTVLYTFLAASALAMITFRPRREDLEDAAGPGGFM